MDSRTFPKAELHCHLDGVLDRTMLRDIRRNDPGFPIDPREFERAYPVHDLESFWNWWRFIDPIESELHNFRPILARYIEQLKTDNVRYAEIMIANGELPGDPIEAVDKVRSFREWVDQQEAGEIQVEFLVANGRNCSPESMAQRSVKFLKLYEAGLIVGIAIAGPEQGHPVRPFQRTLTRLQEAGLGIEVHAGEWCGPESVWDAIEYGSADRIGHGVSLFQDDELLHLVQERTIHIEMCPTSNLKTGSVARIEEHPVQIARNLGLSFSINTDDPGPFECSLASEYELLVDVFGFSEGDFQSIYERIARESVDDEVKREKPKS